VRLQGPAKRLSVFVGESDRHHRKPLYVEIVHRAHAAGLAGATVLRGIEGFGASNHVHTTRLLSLTEDLPVVVVVVDAAERIERFARELDELITEGLVVIDDVEVVRYVGRPAEPGPSR
jgi:PII-like signaling protein